MPLSTLLSKHLTDAANIQESNSVNYFNLCATIWKVPIFEGIPASGPMNDQDHSLCVSDPDRSLVLSHFLTNFLQNLASCHTTFSIQ
jgi:hypothetical protein